MNTITNTESIINFCYFLYNFPGSFSEIVETIFHWDHINNKWKKILNKYPDRNCTSPQMIIDFIMELDAQNQTILIDWINKNYSHKSK